MTGRERSSLVHSMMISNMASGNIAIQIMLWTVSSGGSACATSSHARRGYRAIRSLCEPYFEGGSEAAITVLQLQDLRTAPPFLQEPPMKFVPFDARRDGLLIEKAQEF